MPSNTLDSNLNGLELCRIAVDPSTSVLTLNQIVKRIPKLPENEADAVMAGLVANENSSGTILAQLVRMGKICGGLLTHRNIDESIVEQAVCDPALPPDMESLSASLPNLSAKAAAELARSNSVRTRGILANNPRCPSEALSILAQDDSADVLAFVAANPGTGPDALISLYEKFLHQGFIRKQVAENPSTPASFLTVIAFSDPDEQVVLAATKRLAKNREADEQP